MPRPRGCARAICWSLRQPCSARQEKVQQGQSHIHLPLLARRISDDSRRRGGGDSQIHKLNWMLPHEIVAAPPHDGAEELSGPSRLSVATNRTQWLSAVAFSTMFSGWICAGLTYWL